MSDFQYNCHLNSGFCLFKSNVILIGREISRPMTLVEKFDISSQNAHHWVKINRFYFGINLQGIHGVIILQKAYDNLTG